MARADLVSHWTFDDGSGATAIDAVNAYNGTFAGDPAWNGTGIIGTDSLNFDGNDYLTVGTVAALQATGAVSFSTWWRNPDSPGTQYSGAVMTQGFNYFFGSGSNHNSPGKVWFGYNNGAYRDFLGTNTTWTVDTWYHVAATMDGNAGTINLYLNGMLEGTFADLGARPTNQAAYAVEIARNSRATNQYFVGDLDDLGFWNEALSAQKVALIHGLGLFSGVNLGDASIDAVLAVYNAASGSATAGSETWTYATGLGSTTVGATGGSVGGGDAFIVLDSSGNGVQVGSAVPDTTPPTLAGTNPADGASNVPTGANLAATFSEGIALTGSGTITLKNLSGGADIPVALPGDVSIGGAVLTINPPSNLVAGHEYAVEIGSDAIQDLAATPNPYAGILATDDPNWSFTTDGTPPATSSMGPLAGATGVRTNSDLTLTFDEGVQLGTGTLTIHLASDDSVVQTIDVTGGAVTIGGSSVTIDIGALAYSTAYYVNIAAGAFTDLSGNAYAGISDTTTWAFTTEDYVPPPAGALVFDDFSGDNTTQLVGTTADVGGTWIGTGNTPMKADGTSPYIAGTTGERVAYQPFTLTIGETYTLSADVKVDTGSLNFIGIGFASSAGGLGGTDRVWDASDPYAWIYLNADPVHGIKRITQHVGGANELKIGDTVLDTFVNLKVVLDTSNPADYQATWFVDGVEKATASIGAPSLDHVFIAVHNDTSGAIDNFALTTNVEAAPLVLKISQSGGALDFEWNSLPGMQYDLLSSTDLSTSPATWLPYNDGVTTRENIPATGTTTMLTGVLKVGSARFFALLEEPIPPLFSADFELDNGGFTVTTTEGTDWAWGDPDSSGPGGSVTTGAGTPPSTNCWGTGIGNQGYYADPTTTALRSPVIDLTGVAAAALTFAQALDLDAGDSVTVNIIDDTTDAVIETDIVPITDGNTNNADWASVGPVAIPAAALGQPVRIEWRLNGTGGTSDDYLGWYIDDVVVTATTP